MVAFSVAIEKLFKIRLFLNSINKMQKVIFICLVSNKWLKLFPFLYKIASEVFYSEKDKYFMEWSSKNDLFQKGHTSIITDTNGTINPLSASVALI